MGGLWAATFNNAIYDSLANHAGLKATKTCDRDVVNISETLPPQPTIYNNTHSPSSNTLQVTSITLDSALPSSCPDSSACRPANTMENLNAPYSRRKSTETVEQERPRSAILAVRKRFERMPRKSCSALLRYYNRKFSRTVDIDVLKKFKQNNAEREIRQEKKRERRRIKEIGDIVTQIRKLPRELIDNTVTFLEGICVYKHLGIIEDSRGVPTIKSFEAVQTKLKARVERLIARDSMQEIYFKLLKKPNFLTKLSYRCTPTGLADFSKFDYVVRAVLVKNKIHIRLRCKERLSFPRKELGRCLHRNNNKTYPSLIKNFLKIKYGLEEEPLSSRNSDNEYAEIRVDTRIKTDVKIRCNGPDIFILDKRQNRITLIDVGITTQDSIRIVEQRSLGSMGKQEDCIINCYFRAEMHKQPTPPLKIVDNEEDDLKSENSKHILPLILHSMTTAKEPKTNTNEVLEL
ncbi:hypothetical protein CWI36_0931p0010 [Hamiltosporidium magnivora]|uniref:Uncharacterized protein n=1 Tax=Hamiltosporidium magnivora TaxID=148818 RepID=A0A4Q9L7U0_9MICR|nr:hypothetical protein CWI36_0931p0010 [Hamiltosporidium magnivora]